MVREPQKPAATDPAPGSSAPPSERRRTAGNYSLNCGNVMSRQGRDYRVGQGQTPACRSRSWDCCGPRPAWESGLEIRIFEHTLAPGRPPCHQFGYPATDERSCLPGPLLVSRRHLRPEIPGRTRWWEGWKTHSRGDLRYNTGTATRRALLSRGSGWAHAGQELARVHHVVRIERARDCAHRVKRISVVRDRGTSACRCPTDVRRCRCRGIRERVPQVDGWPS